MPDETTKADIERFIETLNDTFIFDLGEATKRMNDPQATDFDRKTYIRTFFAYVEGMIGSSKHFALRMLALHKDDSSAAQYAMLREESYALNEKGDAVTRGRFVPLTSNVLFALRMHALSFGLNYTPNLGDGGWDAFRAAVKIRNRLTHPRTLIESRVTAEDVATASRASEWFRAEYGVIATLTFDRFNKQP